MSLADTSPTYQMTRRHSLTAKSNLHHISTFFTFNICQEDSSETKYLTHKTDLRQALILFMTVCDTNSHFLYRIRPNHDIRTHLDDRFSQSTRYGLLREFCRQRPHH